MEKSEFKGGKIEENKQMRYLKRDICKEYAVGMG